jgi:SAM-dependent methyltransferase
VDRGALRPLWSPLSSILPEDLPTFATPALLKMLLGDSLRLRYAGDRMWPAVRHGETFPCVPAGNPRPGQVVVAAVEGVPDLLRVASSSGEQHVLVADGDPACEHRVPRSAILAVARLPCRPAPRRLRAARRLWLDTQEARSGAPDRREDAAETVREKYDTQAPFYAGSAPGGLPPSVLEALRPLAPGDAPVLVAGSGAGHECFQLAAAGWPVVGVDFSPSMVEVARREGERRGATVRWTVGDLRRHEEAPGSIAAVVFTNDVYSFLPDPADRIELLRRMGRWLVPGGVVLLSARRVRSPHDARMLTVQWRAARRRGARPPWGASHTRWIDPRGRIRRSFVMVFREPVLVREIVAGGLVPGVRIGGHRVLHRDGAPRRADGVSRPTSR